MSSLEVKKQERETTQGLVRRFTIKVKKSKLLQVARKTKFKRRGKSQQMKKRSALRRVESKKEYEKLRKLGKVEQR